MGVEKVVSNILHLGTDRAVSRFLLLRDCVSDSSLGSV